MPATAAEAIARGVDYLLGQQDAAGGWRRSRYGALRGGAALTALSLRVLSRLADPALTPRSPAALAVALREPLAAAVQFLHPGLERRGAIACPDGTLDLPVYATSLALLAESPARPLWTDAQRQQLCDYLIATQVTARRGFAAADPHLGGWDLGGVPPPQGITTGTNISLTAWALQALAHSPPTVAIPSLRPSSSPAPGAAWRDGARRWLERCQDRPGDGGFVFTPDRTATDNKGGLDPATGRTRSYGSATCDGLLALAALNAQPAEPNKPASTSPNANTSVANPPISNPPPSNTPAANPPIANSPPSHTPAANPSAANPRAAAAAAASSDSAWTAALDWFARLEAWEAVPGGTPALWFYWCARLMEVAEHFSDARREAARTAVGAAIIDRQRAAGSWANPEPAMREDDPLIATPLAIAALRGLN